MEQSLPMSSDERVQYNGSWDHMITEDERALQMEFARLENVKKVCSCFAMDFVLF